MTAPLPRYPVYVPSKGRAHKPVTAEMLDRDGIPFRMVVEEQELDEYAAAVGRERLLVLPFRDRGLVAARNWIMEHSIHEGHARHWQLDDNIRRTFRWWQGKRVRCPSSVALRVVEDFADRYENVAVAGLNYSFFSRQGREAPRAPFWLNVHVYSCSLVENSIPFRWRSVYNDDTDFCLQALAGGWCTVLVNAFMALKLQTMTVSGGNTDALYRGDGRLKMARSLERLWPGVVTTDRRWKRPQHVVRGSWRGFTTPLRLRPGVELDQIPADDYGLRLEAVADVRSARLRQLVADYHSRP